MRRLQLLNMLWYIKFEQTGIVYQMRVLLTKSRRYKVPSWSVFFKMESPKFEVGPILQPTSNGGLLIHIFPDYATDGDDKVYNSRTGMLSKLSRFRAYCNIQMVTYVESLELLDKGTPCGEAMKRTEKKTT